ncbi:hypothetical protein M378DRAFT_154683 [Amanita muscaria Koide BX008]|uniref:Uncharacterized protein n=1 Tax=Amanita muscaria (strain Koide BX008) TaxID=946122 RepID=A0A0C2TV46_AMAMK|nr:hypothetical protein M378DRAFT_154683 [Amanita muscaria Koide BX008]
MSTEDCQKHTSPSTGLTGCATSVSGIGRETLLTISKFQFYESLPDRSYLHE